MFGRKRLALDMLFATACCVIWVGLMTAAEDGSSANSTDALAADSTAKADKPDSGELSLFLEPDTKSTQTKPDNPEEVLKSGVTVASTSSAVHRKPAGGIVPMGGRGTDKAPASLRSRQAQLSLDGTPETIAADRPASGSEPLRPRTFADAGPVLEVFAADKSERSLDGATPVKPLAASSSSTKAPAPKPQPQAIPAAKPAAKPVLAASGKPVKAPKTSKQPVGSKATAPVKPQVAASDLTESLPAADVVSGGTPESIAAAKPVATAPSTPSLREHFTGAETSDSVVLPAGEELVPQHAALANAAAVPADTTSKSEPSIISGRLPKPVQPQSPGTDRPSLAQALNSGEIGAQVPAFRPLNIGLMLALMGGLIALAVWLRGGRSPFSLAEKAVNVIETISIAPGRQIILVEMRGSALVLGVTPQSINLLDKVPLEVLQENYQPTVREIITREGAARADWAARPKVAAMGGGAAVGPRTVAPLGNSYGPPPQGRLTVQQLRQQRSGFHSYRDSGSNRSPRLGELRVTERSSPSGTGTTRLGKAELLDNLREQLRNREQ
jgi:flagellar biogenesis protein FliO